MLGNIGSTVVKLFVVSLLVGMAMSFFDLSPRALLERLGGTAQEIFEIGVGAVEWAVPYVLLGAVVVVPIWIVVRLLKALRGRSR